MSQLGNRPLFLALVGVLAALICAIVLLASGSATNGMLLILLLLPICIAAIQLYQVLDREIRGKWIELDCLPPYRTRSRHD